MTINRVLVLGVVLLVVTICAQAQNSPQKDVEEILARRRSISKEELKDPAMKPVVETLRKQASEGRSSARIALLNAHDETTTQLCLGDLRTGKVLKAPIAAQEMGASNRPDLVAVLGDDLMRQEPSDTRRVGEELMVEKVSVYAAQIMRQIVARSAVFSQNVLTWAQDVEKKWYDRDWAREATRIWWNENQSLLRQGKYDQVKPPSHMPASSSGPSSVTATASPTASP